jgi:quercetin 2,3-dioxygenase
MLLIHENTARGRGRMGWVDAHYSFSFGNFNDPTRMGVGALRVLNEDFIVPGSGFAPHEHKDMDILTYVLSGHLRHEDSMGHASEIRAGEMQLMSAGSGVTHSERNGSESETAHLYQIWLIPDELGGAPSYQELVPQGAGMEAIAGGEGPLHLRSDARVFRVRPAAGEVTHLAQRGRHGFVQIISGLAESEGESLRGGDGVQASGEALPDLTWITEGEALYFDLPR